jgi:hypothetical protein
MGLLLKYWDYRIGAGRPVPRSVRQRLGRVSFAEEIPRANWYYKIPVAQTGEPPRGPCNLTVKEMD